ncbi:pentapeptide repeat-containing protein [Pseudonocardia kunmingensis]|nr:pentapeptide repeat-containing protein [Pseudonocardia kunmingensis]
MRERSMLLVTLLAAILVTVVTTAVLVLVEPAAPRSEAVRTGALSGGAVIALYALWLNDRRRRIEEARHDLEGEKVADERFARSVELLGNDADQVRVGALHALAWLAGSTPRYKQTVLDVLCAYLRRPFEHPGLPDAAEASDATPQRDPVADREREVRLTAQRLITDLLPWGEDRDPRAYHLDLTGARLEHFRLEGRRIGRLTARGARFHGITRLSQLDAAKPVWLTDAVFSGRLDMRDARFHGGVSFRRATFGGEVALAGATVASFVDLTTAAPGTQVGTMRAEDGTRVEGAPGRWAVEALAP